MIKLYLTNGLMEWMFFEMDYQGDRKRTEMVTVSEERLRTVSKLSGINVY